MKITNDDYEYVKGLMSKLVHNFEGDRQAVLEYKEGLKNDSRIKDLDKRFRWDIYRASYSKYDKDLPAKLYKYLNDSHIDSALKSIIKELAL